MRYVKVDMSTCPDPYWRRPEWSDDCLASDHEHDRCDKCGQPVKLGGIHTLKGVWCWACSTIGPVAARELKLGHGWWDWSADSYEAAKVAEQWLRWRKAHQ